MTGVARRLSDGFHEVREVIASGSGALQEIDLKYKLLGWTNLRKSRRATQQRPLSQIRQLKADSARDKSTSIAQNDS